LIILISSFVMKAAREILYGATALRYSQTIGMLISELSC